MKHMSFVPMVKNISPDDAGEVPGFEATVSHWTEGQGSCEEWLSEVGDCWGSAGLAMRRGTDVLGFLVYAPPKFLPHAARLPVGPTSEDAVLLAYVGGDQRTRRHLLVRMLREARSRGVSTVEAVASDIGLPRYTPTKFLIESGWRPVRTRLYRGLPYTLARTDLGSSVEVGELARGLIGRVRFPQLKTRHPVPGALAKTGGLPARMASR